MHHPGPRSAALVFVLGLAACGSNNNKQPDAAVVHDASPDARVCTGLATGMADFLGSQAGANPVIQWGGPITGNLGDGNTLTYKFEFYGGIESSLAGTFDLSAGNQSNYANCAICVRAFELDSGGMLVKQFFQSGGSITLTEDPFTNGHLLGSLSNLQLQEVTVDTSTFMSTPVAGGACTSFADFNVDHDKVPNAWTCTHNKYSDGTNCDCMCGTPDPDCDVMGSTVMGCTTNQVCFNDMCATPPANDTCALATPIVIGTPVTGTTIGAAKNYNAGLEGATCTGVAQAGSDVAYSVALTANQPITVTLSNLDATFDGSIALLGPGVATICDANPITTCVKGADTGAEGENDTFMYTATTAGTYYIIVDSFYTTEAGAFTLTVTSP